MYPSIGIDLGTTNSASSFLDKGKPVPILNDDNSHTTPSVVYVMEGKEGKRQLFVGKRAKNLVVQGAITDIKRMMGSTDHVTLQDIEYTPVEISAMILNYIRQYSQSRRSLAHLGRAVITVPAYFDESQIAATRRAGQMAGFQILKILHEPTAAALAYGLGSGTDQQHVFLVFDLGGGTFDVSVMMQAGGIFNELSVEGDNLLGGTDFDKMIVDHACELINKQYQVDMRTLADKRPYYKLRDEAQRAKEQLSQSEFYAFLEPALYESVDLDFELQRSTFEELIRPRVDESIELAQKAVAGSGFDVNDIEFVLLVGGSTYIPLVRQQLADVFGAEKLRRDVDPMTVVSLGAAVQSALITEVTCPNAECRNKVGLEAAECPHCGQSLIGFATVNCPRCLLPNRQGEESCFKCDTNLTDSGGEHTIFVPTDDEHRAETTEGLQCPNPECEKLNPPGVKECTGCGELMIAALTSLAKSLGIEMADGSMSVVLDKGTPVPSVEAITKRYFTKQANQPRLDVKVYYGNAPVAADNSYSGMVQVTLPEEVPSHTPVDVTFEMDMDNVLTGTVVVKHGDIAPHIFDLERPANPPEIEQRIEDLTKRLDEVKTGEQRDQFLKRAGVGLLSEVENAEKLLDKRHPTKAELDEAEKHINALDEQHKEVSSQRFQLTAADWYVQLWKEYGFAEEHHQKIIAKRNELDQAMGGSDRTKSVSISEELKELIFDWFWNVVISEYSLRNNILSPGLAARAKGVLNDFRNSADDKELEHHFKRLMEIQPEIDQEWEEKGGALIPGTGITDRLV